MLGIDDVDVDSLALTPLKPCNCGLQADRCIDIRMLFCLYNGIQLFRRLFGVSQIKGEKRKEKKRPAALPSLLEWLPTVKPYLALLRFRDVSCNRYYCITAIHRSVLRKPQKYQTMIFITTQKNGSLIVVGTVDPATHAASRLLIIPFILYPRQPRSVFNTINFQCLMSTCISSNTDE